MLHHCLRHCEDGFHERSGYGCPQRKFAVDDATFLFSGGVGNVAFNIAGQSPSSPADASLFLARGHLHQGTQKPHPTSANIDVLMTIDQ